MISWLQHLPVVSIVVPLLAGALILLTPNRHGVRVAIALVSMVIQSATAFAFLYLTTDAMPHMWQQGVGVYNIGGWPAPFGIVLVVDRLAAIMLVLTAVIGSASLVYSTTGWDRMSPGFHSMFQFLMMGLNGAFLTGDLFNLFVFVEVLLASSYGLLLHGSGAARVKSGLHYIAVNLAASFLFLVGVAMIYGITGTLNMADLAIRVTLLDPADHALFESGAAILGVAFFVKAGIWPLSAWLPSAYSAASAPVAAVFALMTKVGVYAVVRVGTLLASGDVQMSFIDIGLFYGGAATVAYGVIGMLAAQHLGRLVSYSVIASTGMLLMTLGLRNEALTAPVLFYLTSSVLATAAFFMVNGLTERMRLRKRSDSEELAPLPDVVYVGFAGRESADPHSPSDEVGVAIPAAMAFLALAFVCCVLLVTGLPPLSGFIAKFAILHVAVTSPEPTTVAWHTWLLVAALLITGLGAVIALTRIGLRLFWSVRGRTTPRLRLMEVGPVAFLVTLCLLLTIGAGPVMTYLEATAHSLHSPEVYVRTVLAHTPGSAAP